VIPGLPLVFGFPLVLGALAGLPLLYFLLRVTPPRARRIPFPPLRLVLDLAPREETSRHTPWWLLLLRLVIAACLILAMAGPVLDPLPGAETGAGPLLVVIDDGWPAAPSFERRIAAASARLEAAARTSRPVAVIAASDGGREILAGEPAKALDRVRSLQPVPYVPDRRDLLASIESFLAHHPGTSVLWIADGTASGHARLFAESLVKAGAAPTIVIGSETVRGSTDAQNRAGGLSVRVLRSAAKGPDRGLVRAFDRKQRVLGEAAFDFAGSASTTATFEMPVELRNEVARLEIVGERSAGAVTLLDARSHRHRVGLVSGETADVAQPLLAPRYYLERALLPFADVRAPRPGDADPISDLLAEKCEIMILADIGAVPEPARTALAAFVEEGGVLVRFAGSRLAGAADDLVPVRLRRGGRVLGGAMSWDTPKKLAPFAPQSPFHGLAVPEDVTIGRQVLAEPDPGLPAKTWAALQDGTPLVTATRSGKGLSILFHVTADTTWSNLPISGLFVDMLKKLVDLSGDRAETGTADLPRTEASDPERVLAPTRILDGFGILGPPPPSARPVPYGYDGPADAGHLPGLYGPPEALLAVNTLGAGATLEAAVLDGLDARLAPLESTEPVDLVPSLGGPALVLFLAAALASLWLSGRLPRLPRRAAARTASIALLLAVSLSAVSLLPSRASAEPAVSARDLESALTTRLAYVTSGDAAVDEASRRGLQSLSLVLARRTALVPGDPVGLDPAKDELGFYPLLYWPIVATRPQPSREAVAKAAAFMKQGGTIVFDTRDAMSARPGGAPSPEALWLRQLLAGVDVPELEPIPADHVVTKTFYLIDGFVGRYTLGQTWIETLPPATAGDAARPARSGDGVSPIVITGNDLAAGWASDGEGESYYSLVPGGHRQHELALRGGVNLVMYTLTGNYKADQVHVRDLLERLGH
jgi:hypothetical protein